MFNEKKNRQFENQFRSQTEPSTPPNPPTGGASCFIARITAISGNQYAFIGIKQGSSGWESDNMVAGSSAICIDEIDMPAGEDPMVELEQIVIMYATAQGYFFQSPISRVKYSHTADEFTSVRGGKSKVWAESTLHT